MKTVASVLLKRRLFFKKIWFCGLLIIIPLLFSFRVKLSRIHKHYRVLSILNNIDDYETIENVESVYTNIPLKYWVQVMNQSQNYMMNDSCAEFPNLFELEIRNSLWQMVEFTNASLQLFNAYYDARNFTSSGMTVRIICMINRIKVNFKSYCQMWFKDEPEPVITQVELIHYMFEESWHMQVDNQYGPYLIECKIPESHKKLIPEAVSIVEKPCDNARNLMKVHSFPIPEIKKNFAVCVKGMDFLQEDFSARLVEWLELVFLMGADKVFMYNLQMHPNMKKIIDYYQKIGKVDCRFLTLPEGQTNIPLLQHFYIKTHGEQKDLNEIIPYNDCFYRNIHLYKYVVLLDVDEIIVPQKDFYDWEGLVKRHLDLSKPGERFASISARNTYFLDDMMPEGVFPDIPPHMHMLQHVYRSYNFTPSRWFVKSLFNTDYVLTCHNHYPMIILPNVLNYFEMDIEDAHMQHYRTNCSREVKCELFRNHTVKDDGLWLYKDVLIERSNKVLEDVGLLKDLSET